MRRKEGEEGGQKKYEKNEKKTGNPRRIRGEKEVRYKYGNFIIKCFLKYLMKRGEI